MIYTALMYKISDNGDIRSINFINFDVVNLSDLRIQLQSKLNSKNIDYAFMNLNKKEYQIWYDLKKKKKEGWGRRVSRPIYDKDNDIIDLIAGDLYVFRIRRNEFGNIAINDITSKSEAFTLIENIEKEACIAMDSLTGLIKYKGRSESII